MARSDCGVTLEEAVAVSLPAAGSVAVVPTVEVALSGSGAVYDAASAYCAVMVRVPPEGMASAHGKAVVQSPLLPVWLRPAGTESARLAVASEGPPLVTVMV